MLHLLALAWRGPVQYRARPVQYRARAGTAAGRVRAAVTVDDSCELDDPAVLCTYDPLAIDARFADRQWEVFGRIGGVGLAAHLIEIFDANQPFTTLGFRIQVASERGNEGSKV